MQWISAVGIPSLRFTPTGERDVDHGQAGNVDTGVTDVECAGKKFGNRGFIRLVRLRTVVLAKIDISASDANSGLTRGLVKHVLRRLAWHVCDPQSGKNHVHAAQP